jgi:uncharacterized membrane protein YciS (DUF1049 family)
VVVCRHRVAVCGHVHRGYVLLAALFHVLVLLSTLLSLFMLGFCVRWVVFSWPWLTPGLVATELPTCSERERILRSHHEFAHVFTCAP